MTIMWWHPASPVQQSFHNIDPIASDGAAIYRQCPFNGSAMCPNDLNDRRPWWKPSFCNGKMIDIKSSVHFAWYDCIHTWHNWHVHGDSEPLEIEMLVLRLSLLRSLIRSHRSLAHTIHSLAKLALHCSLRSRASLCSLLRSFALCSLPSSWDSVYIQLNPAITDLKGLTTLSILGVFLPI